MDDSTISLFDELCHKDNLRYAYEKARKRKTQRKYVLEFEENLKENLQELQQELRSQAYRPKPLQTFILHDPKTRKINKSAFRDRIVHHAICNVIEPFFEKRFIFDSYANRKRKGTLKAIERFEFFANKVSRGYTRPCYVLKADIRHYFETVDHNLLLSILQNKINDERILCLIKTILDNYHTDEEGKGMPLGNLTSQFFAKVYLNELDQFVKHMLKAQFYLRYVDDFVILGHDHLVLTSYLHQINEFCINRLSLKLHPDKSKVFNLARGVNFLGFRNYPHHKRIIKKGLRRFERKLMWLHQLYQEQSITREKAMEHFEGWLAHISKANTFKYQKHVVRMFNQLFPIEEMAQPQQYKKHHNFMQKTEEASLQFSVQKTLQLYNAQNFPPV